MTVILNNTFGAEYVFDPESGHFISEKHQRIAEIINDYNPNLFLAWIPPKDRVEGEQKPFGILHKMPDGSEYVVSKFAEEEINEHLLAKIFMMDAVRNDPMAYLESLEAAEEAIRLKKEIEAREEMHDRAKSILRTPLHTYRLSKDKKLNL